MAGTMQKAAHRRIPETLPRDPVILKDIAKPVQDLAKPVLDILRQP
jgi:hypothetical protein